MKNKYVVLDIETTGLMFEYFDEVIEICAIPIEDNKKKEHFHSYIKPKKKIPKKITEITGITNNKVSSAPSSWVVLKKLRELIGDSIVVAYNARFDVDFLNHWFYLMKLDPITHYCCAMDTFKDNIGKRVNLAKACEHYGIVLDNAHSALYDTIATSDLFLKMIDEGFVLNDVIRSEAEVFTRHKRRVICAKYNDLIQKQVGVIQGIEHPIISDSEKELVFQMFDRKSSFRAIVNKTGLTREEVHGLFVSWVNPVNYVKYLFLYPDSVRKYLLEVLKIANYQIEPALEINKEIVEKKTKNAYPRLIMEVVLKLFSGEGFVYRLSDFIDLFESGKTIDRIASLKRVHIDNIIEPFSDWLTLEEDNREIYRDDLRNHLISKSELSSYKASKDKQAFIFELPEQTRYKYVLTESLYQKGFFKVAVA